MSQHHQAVRGEAAGVPPGGRQAYEQTSIQTYDHANSAMLYAVRQARLIEAIGADSDPEIPRRVLDAGCGEGYFSRSLVRFGHQVDGIDTSTSAITQCRRLAIGSETYAVSSLRSWRPAHLYDAVVCIDVMSHLMDDDEWLASLRNLAVLVRLGGRLVVGDHDAEDDILWGSSQKTRARSRYDQVLRGQGLEIVDFIRDDLTSDQAGMHLALRVA